MAKYKITPDKSIISFADFALTDAGTIPPLPNSLTVDANAFLISTVTNGVEFGQNWTIVANGFIGSTAASDQSGIYLYTPSLAAASSLTVGPEGGVFGAYGFVTTHKANVTNNGSIRANNGDAVLEATEADGNFKITNNGTLWASHYGIYLRDDVTGTHTIVNHGDLTGMAGAIVAASISLGIEKVTNSGRIVGDMDLGDGADSVTNSGVVFGALLAGAGNDVVSNSGDLGTTQLQSGNDRLTNSGNIRNLFDAGGGNDVIINTGSILIGVDLGDGNDTLTNSHEVTGSITAGLGDDKITNSGIAQGFFIDGGDGNDTITNSGSVAGDINGGNENDTIVNSKNVGGHIDGGAGNDTITNSGTVEGDVSGGIGRDKFTNTGLVKGIIHLDDGDDTVIGGSKSETVADGDGTDTVHLGAGNDRYVATGNTGFDGVNDTIDAGTGVDIYDASSATKQVIINIGAQHDFFLAHIATGFDVGYVGLDIIVGFEDVFTGNGNDIVNGSAAANRLDGGGDDDFLFGLGGADLLIGGAGNDTLVGGAGRDRLGGGSGDDTFRYDAVSDSGVGSGARDIIGDFAEGQDTIDFSAIDANAANGSGTNDSFIYIGENTVFTGVAGQLRIIWSADGQIFQGDVNGDKKPDFAVEVLDPTHSFTLTGVDFLV